MKWLPPLTALRAFEAAGRKGVVEAASHLNVTPAAINHQIKQLEAELGVTLFTRMRGRGPQLTPKGEAYLADVAQIFDKINESTRAIRDDCDRSKIVVDSLTSFSTNFLIPALPKFLARSPKTEVEFLSTVKNLKPLALEARGADVAIRLGFSVGHWENMHAEELMSEVMFPVCAPSLLEGPNALKEPKDLAKHRLLTVSSAPEGWRNWLASVASTGEDVSGVELDNVMKFDLYQLSLSAAVAGLGVDMARAPLVRHLVDEGKLAIPFEHRLKARTSYWLIATHEFAETELFEEFRAWLFEEIALFTGGSQDQPDEAETQDLATFAYQ